MRTRIYNSIVDLLSDGSWHWLTEIGEVTAYPDRWVRLLAHDKTFEFDSTLTMIRLSGRGAMLTRESEFVVGRL